MNPTTYWIFVLSFCIALRGVAQKNTIEISGYIIDKITRNRLHTAEIQVKDLSPIEVSSEGAFRFEIKRKWVNKSLVFKVKAPGYDDLTFVHWVSNVQSLNTNLEIEMSHNSYTIVGQILDSQTKEPPLGERIQISVLGEPGLNCHISDDGSFLLVVPLKIAEARNKKITLLIDAPGYAPKLIHAKLNTNDYHYILGLCWLDKN